VRPFDRHAAGDRRLGAPRRPPLQRPQHDGLPRPAQRRRAAARGSRADPRHPGHLRAGVPPRPRPPRARGDRPEGREDAARDERGRPPAGAPLDGRRGAGAGRGPFRSWSARPSRGPRR
jgi:hypothetical protein